MPGDYVDKEGYKDGSWDEYSVFELGMFVHLLMKRATHRTDPEKKTKDLRDALNYGRMLMSKVEHEVAEDDAPPGWR